MVLVVFSFLEKKIDTESVKEIHIYFISQIKIDKKFKNQTAMKVFAIAHR